jgi:Family of unknown function (DUF6516)
MKAELLFKQRITQGQRGFAELVLWHLPEPVMGSVHPFKYRLVLIVDGQCALRYDNEAGKGDHKHTGMIETDYKFESPGQLLADFWHDVDLWRAEHE